MKFLRYTILLSVMGILNACERPEDEVFFQTEVYNLHAEEFMQKYKASKSNQLVDIRTLEEYKSGHIQYAIQIDYYKEDFKTQLVKQLNKGVPVFIYCRSGNRTGKTVEIMKELGFKEVNNLVGGYNELVPFTDEC
ncbi:MAG: rhodanese-like domain-containing protein [Bacteroidetes bacterium]|nr:rhodanese-like domain-containing protein [Bacteroidota bacterium]